MKKFWWLSMLTFALMLLTVLPCFAGDTAATEGVGDSCSHLILGDWEVYDEPTMLTPGLEVRHCTVCGEIVESRKILSYLDDHDLNGCKYDYVGTVEPTCTETGYEEYKCWICDNYDYVELPITEHIPGEWVTVEMPETGATRSIQSCVSCDKIFRSKGKCGDNAFWALEDGKLTVSGSGNMYDFYGDDTSPWRSLIYSITEVAVSNGITNISGNAFNSCIYLTTVSLPDSVKAIESGAFTGCESLAILDLPQALVRLDDWLYKTSIKELYIPASVESIVFSDGEIIYTIDNDNLIYTSYQGVVYDKERTTLIYAPKAKVRSGFVIPDGVTAIADWSLSNSHLEIGSITYPASITYIGEQFWDHIDSFFAGNIHCYKGSYADEFFSGWISDMNDIIIYITDGNGTKLGFTDVKAGAWYEDAVSFVVSKGYMKGMSDTVFSPNSSITREQFVLILANMVGVDTDEYKNVSSGFADVKAGLWYSGAVTWAVREGYVSGLSATRFGTGQSLQRAALARLLYAYAEKNGKDVSGRADLSGFGDAAEFAKSGNALMVEPVQWAVDAGIISGMNVKGVNCVNPKGTATRAQAARMLMVFDEIK